MDYNCKYPVVLVHGMMLKDFKLYRAFRKIKDVLKDNGVHVYVGWFFDCVNGWVFTW